MADERRARETREGEGVETREPEFPEIEKRRAFDREEHARRAEAAGLPAEKAKAHADEDVADGARDEGKR